MSNKRGFQSVGLALALAAAMAVQPALADQSGLLVTGGEAGQTEQSGPAPVEHSPYPDVAVEDWFCPYVADLSANGSISGYPDGTYGPQRTVTVGEALVMVLAAAGYDRQEPTGEHWSSGNADFARNKGFATGAQVADLDAPVDRLTVAQIAAKALNLRPSRHETPFADTADGYVVVLYEKVGLSGEVGADGLRLYHPEESITRAELSAIVWRMQNTDVHAGQIKYSGYSQTFYLDVMPEVPAFSLDKSQFRRVDGYLTYQGEDAVATLGIDVSQFQGDIDWNRVRDAGIQYAIVRVGGRGYTKGAIYEDTKWRQNIEGAQAAGLDVGAYFFSQAITVEEALEEADFVLERVRDYDLTMPVVFDWELTSDSDARSNHVDNGVLNQAALAFCDRVAQAGFTPMVYFNAFQGYVKYDLSMLMQYPFWFAQYQDQPQFYYDFQMWQYSSKGSVDGIEGNVDMNLWFGGQAKPEPEPPEPPQEPEPEPELPQDLPQDIPRT